MICGVCGLFMKYNQNSSFAYIRWLGPAHGLLLRSTAIACFFVGAVLVRCGLASPDQSLVSSVKSRCDQFAQNLVCASNLFLFGADFGLRIVGKERTTIKDAIYGIPTVYLLYVLLAIVVIAAAAVIAIIRML
jgi:hypothetical protein